MHKIQIACQASEARGLADCIGMLDEPAPLAVSWFERSQEGRPDPSPLDAWIVEAYFAEPVLPEDIARAFTDSGEQTVVAGDITVTEVIEENWVARVQSELAPVTAGRFLVYGSHDRHRARGYRGALWIDAGEAFGTAHHATTEGCLIALDRILRGRAPRRMLDLGTGSAVLAIAVARMAPEVRVIATDIDPQAVDVAIENCALNQVAGRIRVIVAGGLDHPALRGPAALGAAITDPGRHGRFDLITANILAQPLIAFAPQLMHRLTTGGTIVLSGLVDEQAAGVIARYHSLGARLQQRIALRGWTTLIMQKRRGSYRNGGTVERSRRVAFVPVCRT